MTELTNRALGYWVQRTSWGWWDTPGDTALQKRNSTPCTIYPLAPMTHFFPVSFESWQGRMFYVEVLHIQCFKLYMAWSLLSRLHVTLNIYEWRERNILFLWNLKVRAPAWRIGSDGHYSRNPVHIMEECNGNDSSEQIPLCTRRCCDNANDVKSTSQRRRMPIAKYVVPISM